jgi:uncharacterized membrane protein YqiK
MQLMQIIGDRHVRLIPDVLVGNNGSGSSGLVDGLLSLILWNQTNAKPFDPKKVVVSEAGSTESAISLLLQTPLGQTSKNTLD